MVGTKGAGTIRVRIYDQRGRLVWSHDTLTAGNVTEVIYWTAVDNSGGSVAPGVYPVFIQAPGIKYSDNLIVIR